MQQLIHPALHPKIQQVICNEPSMLHTNLEKGQLGQLAQVLEHAMGLVRQCQTEPNL